MEIWIKNKKGDILVKEVFYIILFILAFSLVLYPFGKQAILAIFGNQEKMQAQATLNSIADKITYMEKRNISVEEIMVLNPEEWYLLLNPNKRNELCICPEKNFGSCSNGACKKIEVKEEIKTSNDKEIELRVLKKLIILKRNNFFEIDFIPDMKKFIPEGFSFGGGKCGGAGAQRPLLQGELSLICNDYGDIDYYRKQVKKPIFWVSDYEDVIQDKYEFILDKTLAEINKTTGVQIAIVSWNGEVQCPNKLGFAICDLWGLGKKGLNVDKNNGILIVFSLENNKFARIQLGYSNLQGALTDGVLGKLIDENLMPNLNKKDIGKGLVSLVNELNSTIEKNIASISR